MQRDGCDWKMRTSSLFSKWKLVLACTFYSFNIAGISKVHGLIFVALYTSSNISRSEASWPFNLVGVAQIAIAPLTGFLSLRFSPRFLATIAALLFVIGQCACSISLDIPYFTVCYGIVRSCGISMALTIIPSILTTNYDKNTASVIGLDQGLSATASFVFPPLTVYLLETYELKGCMLLLGGIALHSLLGVILIVEPTGKENANANCQLRDITTYHETKCHKNDAKENSLGDNSRSYENHRSEMSGSQIVTESSRPSPAFRILKEVLLTPGFYLITFNTVASSYFSMNLAVFVIDHMKDKGIPLSQGSYLLSAYGLGQMLGNLGLGWITDKKFVSSQTYLGALNLLTGMLALILAEIESFEMFLLLGIFIGITQGTRKSVGTAVFKDYVSSSSNMMAMGCSRCLKGISLLTRASLVGYFRDSLGTYDNIFRLNGVLLFVVAAMWFTERCFTRKCGRNVKRRKNDTSLDIT